MAIRFSTKRLLEVVPGATVWFALIAPVVLSSVAPAVVAIFILLFDLYWLYKAVIMGAHLLAGYRRMRNDIKHNWRAQAGAAVSEIYHAIILTTYLEPEEVIAKSLESIRLADYPQNRLVVVLATEGREGAPAKQKAARLNKIYGKRFAQLLITVHPGDIAGERKAKGANATWAAKKLSSWARRRGIKPEDILVTTADADTRFHKQYFACLTHHYATAGKPSRRSYQPIPIYANNIWQAPALSRILAFGSSFWQLIESTRPWRLITFSTHAMSLKTLQEINYWDVTVINEDSRQFWRAYFAFGGDHRVVPIFVPVYMDAVLTDTYLGTLRNQYRQRLRWAYGAEHFSYVVTSSLRHPEIPFLDRLIKAYRLFEANFSWATASIFLAFVGWIPLILNREFSETVLGHNVPIFASRILSLTWLGLAISAFIALKLLPPKPPGVRKTTTLIMVLQWILAPISALVFGSIPAIDAQTRLMLGRPFGFWTTAKKSVGS